MKHLILAIASLLVLSGCMEHGSMKNMPCHQMSNGEWMGNCDEIENTKEVSTQPPIDHAMPAKSSTIVELTDGEVYELSADIVRHSINGYEHLMYGYNGMIPGPGIKVSQGSTITVEFTNNIDLNTTVHWHGLRHDINNDGVPGVSQPPIQPGESFTYTVYFPDEGIYWYHPHIREDITQDRGLAGNMLVTEAYDNPVNQEELLVLDDILIENNRMVPYGEDHANFVVMGRFGNVMLINGKTDYALQVNKGDVVRFYITNVANVRPFNLSFDGAKIKLVGSDLSKYEQEEFVDSIVIAPAERYIVDVYFEESKPYSIVNKNPSKTYTLGRVLVNNKISEVDYVSSFNTLKVDQTIKEEMATIEDYYSKEPDYTINLTIDMPMNMMHMQDMPCHQMPDGTWMGNCEEEEKHEDIEWEDDMGMMNRMSSSEQVTWILRDAKTGKENMDIQMSAKIGDKVKIRFFNDPESMHPMQHPIHLHGQRFVVLSIDDIQVENRVWKDTVLVPTGKTIDILVDVTNPGEWMMHCHIAEHLEAGMMASFVVDDA